MRVVIAVDAVLLRQGVVRLLVENGIVVSGEASDAGELLALVEQHRPDVAIVDIRMPPGFTDEGLVAAQTIRRRHSEIGVLVLSQFVDAAYALRLIDGEHVRCGYLLKDRILDAQELVSAVRRVHEGDVVVDADLVQELLGRQREANPLDELTRREREVLQLMAEGLTDRGIATRLWLTPRTVETHVRHILQKLGIPADTAVNRRVHAVLVYLRA